MVATIARIGTLGTGSATTAGTTITVANTTGAIIVAGTFVHLAGTWDNIASVTPPTITCSTVGGGTAIANHITPTGSGVTTTAGAGIWHTCFRVLTTADIAIGATIATLTSNQSAVSRSAVAVGYSGADTTLRTAPSVGVPVAGTAVNLGTAGVTISVPYPAAPVVGDTLVMELVTGGTTTIATPSGWTLGVVAVGTGAQSPSVALFVKAAAGGETGSLAVTIPSATGNGRMWKVPGVDTANIIDVGGTSVSPPANTTINIPTLTTSRTGCLLFVAGGSATAAGTFNPPTVPVNLWTEDWDTPTSVAAAADYLVWSGSGPTGIIDLTRSSVIRSVGMMIALRPIGSVSTAISITGSPSVVTAGTALVAGDLVIGTGSSENNALMTGDADTLNGSWSATSGVSTASGAAAANTAVTVQGKIITATGAQTFNPTLGVADTVACVYAVQPQADIAVTQSSYRFYGDGSESGSTALVAQDTAYTADLSSADANLQVRFRLQSTSTTALPPTDDWALQWEKNASGTWTDVGVGTSTVAGYDSPLLDNTLPSTNRMGAGTGSFTAGDVTEDGVANDQGWPGLNYTEHLYSITLKKANLANADTLRFRVLRNGATTGMTYTAVPTINVTTLTPITITRSTTWDSTQAVSLTRSTTWNVAALPLITQAAYRFYDDGTEAGSVALAAQNTTYPADLSSADLNLHLRTRLQLTTSDSALATDDWLLQVEKNASGVWRSVSETTVDSYTNTTGPVTVFLGSSVIAVGQSFVGNGSNLTRATFHIFKNGTPSGSVSLKIFAHAGTFGSTGTPTGSASATSTNSVVLTSLTTTSAFVSFTFDGTFTLVSGTNYFLVAQVSTIAPDNANTMLFSTGFGAPAHPGNRASQQNSTQVWSAVTPNDVFFEVFGKSSEAVGYDSPNLTDAGATTSRLGAGTGSFVAGKVSEDGLVDDLGITGSNYTEVLHSITLKKAALANGDTLRFRVLRNGVADRFTYTQTPTVSVSISSALTAVTITRSTTWDSTRAISLTRSTTWDTLVAITPTRQTTWDVLTPVTKTLSSTWRVQQAVALTRSTTWNAKTAVSITRVTTWDALTPVALTRVTTWDTTFAVTKALSSTTWRVRQAVSLTRGTTWNSRFAVAITRATTWNSRFAVAITRQTTWDVLTPVTKALSSTTWRVQRAVAITRITTWDVTTAATITRSTTWRALKSHTLTRQTTWNAELIATITRAVSWDTRLAVPSSRQTTWDVTTPVAVVRSTTWDVTTAITLTRPTSWDVTVAITRTRSTTWNIRSAPTLTRSTTWDTLLVVARVRSTTWQVTGQVSTSRVVSWRTLARVTVGGAGPAERMLDDSLPTTTATGTFTLGARFVVNADGYITHVRYYQVAGAPPGTSHTVSIWDANSQTRLATTTFVPVGG